MDFSSIEIDSLLETLKTTENGLSETEAKERLQQVGLNVVSREREKSLLHDLLDRFKNPLIILLLITSFAALFLGQSTNFFLILLMVFLSILLGLFQERSANQSARKLRESVELKTNVIRNKKEKQVPVSQIVPGDLIHLKAGNLVPADGRLLSVNNLFVNQSVLTGESFPVEKLARLKEKERQSEYPTNMAFMGTSVVSGEGTMLVCRTGRETSLGQIGESLSKKAPVTHFELESRKFSLFLMRITIFLVVFVLVANLFFFRPWVEAFLFALALAVGMTPEFLPMVMTVTLSRGAQVLAKKKVIVKRLSAIHDLGAVDILCSDKTGTLTEAIIQLKDFMAYDKSRDESIRTLAYLNSYFQTGYENPLDEAILKTSEVDVGKWKKLDETPFDFERKRISLVLENEGQQHLIVKGSPSNVLDICSFYKVGGNIKKITKRDREKLNKLYLEQTHLGLRALAVALKTPENQKSAEIPEKDLVFIGFLFFYDPPKKGIAKVIEDLKNLGVNIKILTGDNKGVAIHLCQELKIPSSGVITGQEISSLDDFGLRTAVSDSNIFCQVTPLQKRLIIDELKSSGSIVAFLGDGINDAPSLYNAHVGISVNKAADVAKESADLILLERSLSVIVDGIIEGRKIFANIIKYIKMMTSSNFGNMCSMAAASLFIPFLPMLPVQILLNNFLYDLSQTVIPFDRVDEEQTRKPEQWNFRYIFKFMVIMGPLSSAFDFIFFGIMLFLLKTSPALFQTGWFMESIATQILIIFIIRTPKSAWASRPHISLVIMAIILVGIGIIFPYITPISPYLGFVSPPITFIGIIAAIVIVYLFAAEKVKRFIH